eukprot:1991563-Rhodomonas_salina.1
MPYLSTRIPIAAQYWGAAYLHTDTGYGATRARIAAPQWPRQERGGERWWGGRGGTRERERREGGG